MPEMDGLEASRRITAKWQRNERPRIIVWPPMRESYRCSTCRGIAPVTEVIATP